ncbi:MAG TPA: ATP-binding protein [Candidatus Acidoferrum sp.]|nr:ATP-binding protein [Candidatus Acidoferrum sp.]
MAASFRTRLFRLFLVFAIIPALLVTALAFYLQLSSGNRTGGDEKISSSVTDYYSSFVADRIDREIDQYLSTGSTTLPALDYLFIAQAGLTTRVIGSEKDLSAVTIREIVKATTERTRGIVQSDKRFYQYVARPQSSGATIVAGMFHGRDFAALLDAVRSESATRSIGRELHTQYLYFLVALFLGLLVLTYLAAFAFSSRLSTSLSRPLIELSDASRKIAVGDFRQTVGIHGTDEMKTLIVNFNTMASQLDNTTSRLAQTERVAAWRQVARRFAHELKNPLQPILVSLYRIEKQLFGTESYDKIYEPLKAAADEVKHLSILADRFSHLAKLPPPNLERTDLRELAVSITELYRDKLSVYTVTTALPDSSLSVVTDVAYVREIVHNLLQNAIDASEPGGRIHIALERKNREALLSVADSGIGMDAETLASARLPYFTTKEKGTGLGLAIVEKSISELGGRLIIESAKGHGTRVTITLPLES